MVIKFYGAKKVGLNNYVSSSTQPLSAKDIQEFSQRRQGIVEKAEEVGATNAESLAYIAKTTREKKTHHSMGELKADWEQRGDLEHILQIKTESKEVVLEQSPVSQTELLNTALKNAIESLSEREATFKAEDLHSHMIDMTKNKYAISEIESTISEHVAKGKLLHSKDKENYSYTTSKNLAQEKQTVKLMRNGQGNLKALCGKKELQQFLSGTNLNQGQKDAVQLMLHTEDRVVGIQGAAGTAKTTMISAAMAFAGIKGYQFIGLAPTKEAAKVLNHSAHIESQTLHLFLARYDGVLKGRGTAQGIAKMKSDFKNKVVILDEASLASTGHINKLLTLSERLKFRCALVGDIKQLGAVESGKPFDTLQNHGMKTAILYDIKRQQNDELLKSVYSAVSAIDQDKGDARSSIFASLKSIGLSNVIDLSKQEKSGSNQDGTSNSNSDIISNTKVLPEDLVDGAYAAWVKEKNASSEDTNILVVAPSNSLRQALNNKMRTHYISDSETDHTILESKNLTHSQSKNVSKYNQGDVIVFNKVNNNLSIEKGSYYKVISIDKKADSLLLVNANKAPNVGQKTINWSPNKALSKQEKGLIEVYQKRTLPIAVGEKIRWTKNSKDHEFVVNGGTATIKRIGASSIKVEVQSDIPQEASKIITLDRTDPVLQHLDYAYCSTIYSSQGKTVDTVIGIARSRESVLALTTQRSFYVTLSRARHKAILITDSYNGLIRRLSEVTGAKSSAIEHQTTESRVQAPDVANLKKEGRSIFIGRNRSDKDIHSSTSTKPNNINSEAIEDFDSFIRNSQKVRDAAIYLFGAPNKSLSQHHNLRFGRKGSIAVNTESGQWYDFSDGSGGSIYSLAKRGNLLDKESDIYNMYSVLGKNQPSEAINSHNIESNSLKTGQSNKKREHVDKLIKDSVPLNEYITPASSYLVDHRKINFRDVPLSDDIRFTFKAWSSETKEKHPALVSIARDSNGRITASQVVYLDKKSFDKDKSLKVQKRSQGILKGSFVELTTNKDAKTIFIAEGVETGLSIASAQPKARVICSLGISNIRNIDLSTIGQSTGKDTAKQDTNLKNKTIIICADNDGKASKTNVVIEQAASTLKDQGFKAVSIIRPDTKGQDFNDVLQKSGSDEVKKYIAPLLRNHPDYKKQLNTLEEKLDLRNRSLELLNDSIKSLPVFKDHNFAITKWKELVEKNGVAGAKELVRNDPGQLGTLKGLNLFIFQTKGRVAAVSQANNLITKLAEQSIETEAKDKLKQQKENIVSQLKNKYLESISNFKTAGLDHKEINFKLTRAVQHSLAAIDKSLDYEAVKFVTQKVTEQIILYRQRYREEPNADLKTNYFLGARHESEQKGFLEKELDKLIPGDSLKERVMKAEKLDRLSSIDLRLTQETTNNTDKLFYKPVPFKDVMLSFKEGNGKISILTYNHMQQGMNEIKANFVATEIVKYEEKIGAPMPIKQQENLQKVGGYVSNNYKELIGYGFSKDEARIAYLEGSKLAMNYKPTERDLAISRGEIQLTQADIKRTIERHGFCKPNKSMAINKEQIQTEDLQKTKTISHEKGSIEIEM